MFMTVIVIVIMITTFIMIMIVTMIMFMIIFLVLSSLKKNLVFLFQHWFKDYKFACVYNLASTSV